MKSFRAKDGSDEPPSGGRNGERDFHGETHSNDTHPSTTDPEPRHYRKGKGREAKLCYIGNRDRRSYDTPSGFAISQQKRKHTEEPFGWAKTIRGLAQPTLRGRTLEIQVHSDDGGLRPDPVAELAWLACMTSRKLSKMESTPTKLAPMNSLSPCPTADHHAPSARISVACWIAGDWPPISLPFREAKKIATIRLKSRVIRGMLVPMSSRRNRCS